MYIYALNTFLVFTNSCLKGLRVNQGTGITRIELDAHRSQTFLWKISVQRALYWKRYVQNIVKYGQNTNYLKNI